MKNGGRQQKSVELNELGLLATPSIADPHTLDALFSRAGDPEITETAEAPRKDVPQPKSNNQPFRNFHGGWRTGVALGTLGAFIVLIINISLLIWIKANHHVPNDGVATVYEGSCSKKTSISVWCHLAINVCSTLLLSASNNAMQCLSAPMRADVNSAHSRGMWLDIGIPSIKNLHTVGWRRVTLWAVLGLSSLPLHLL